METEPKLEANRFADQFFRHEAGKIVSMLVMSFGTEHLQLAEDVVQEALVRALRLWPFQGIPENPAGWIAQTAKNLALDAIRRDHLFRRKQIDIFGSVHRWSAQVVEEDLASFGREVEDAVLRLMFVCCHPTIPENSQPVLALKTLCGFGTPEIARALFSTEASIQKRLTRAKEQMSEGQISAELPVGEDLESRLNGVLKTLYLLFNEGYKASSGPNLVKEDLCAEAIRLMTLLTRMSVGNRPQCHALLALMYLHAARLPTRVDSRGNILLLRDQDRTLWDQNLIGLGLLHLQKSASGEHLDRYHLQAAIAAIHCTSSDFASTDWATILSLYDFMILLDDSPVVALNRAVVIGLLRGPQAGIEAIETIPKGHRLDAYYLLYAVQAEYAFQLERYGEAADLLRLALDRTTSASEREFLCSRLRQCELKLFSKSDVQSEPPRSLM